MVYKQDNIENLVEKYWKGDTSLEEEAVLGDYFRYNDYPERFIGVAQYFIMLAEEDGSLGQDFDDEILERIGPQENSGRVISLHRAARYLAVACIAMVIGTSVWYAFKEEPAQPIAVTLEDPDVRAAFEKTKSALMMVGNRLNEGKEQALKLNKYNVATQVMKERQP
jgi:hypothetical protein